MRAAVTGPNAQARWEPVACRGRRPAPSASARTGASASRPVRTRWRDRRCRLRTPRWRSGGRRGHRAGRGRSAADRADGPGCGRAGQAGSAGLPDTTSPRRRAPACRLSGAAVPGSARCAPAPRRANPAPHRSRVPRWHRGRGRGPGWNSLSGNSLRRAASLAPGAMIRLAIMASTRSRSRDGVRLSSRGRSSLRTLPSTAAPWPCGKARWTSTTSPGRAIAVPPCRSTRRPSITGAGSWPRLARVRFLTVRPSR